MTQNRRIVLNVLATYGRSLYSLVCGLFTARWVLMALGQTDFGLYGVVGGLVVVLSFLNIILASAVGRFYAFYVGAARTNVETGIQDCQKWFNTALLIHTVIPVVLLVVGYPVGVWAVKDFLAIPPEKVSACIWVWRMVCASCFVSMVNVPFQAMYTAKQEIAELTVYSVVTTTLNVIMFYYMACHPGGWLVKYAVWMCLISVAPQLVICWRAVVRFPECKIVCAYLYDAKRIKDIFIYAVSRTFAVFSSICDAQGQAILVNKYLGPKSNATMTIGNGIAGHSQTLSSAISGAFWPAITNYAGEGNFVAMRELVYRCCKLSTLMLLVFVVPLVLEIHEVIRLWLKTPPPQTAEFCIFILACAILEKLSDGISTGIFAMGKVVGYSCVVGWTGIGGLFIAWGLLFAGWGILGVGVGRVVARVLTVIVRLHFGRVHVGLSPGYWIGRILVPIAVMLCFTMFVGYLPHLVLEPSLVRVVVSTLVCELVMIPCAWFLVLSEGERLYVGEKFEQIRKRFMKTR